jgi:amino-acid N-acetyltransferase
MSPPILACPTLEAATRLLNAASLPTSDLTDAHMERFYYCGPPNQLTGLVGFEIHGSDALLRSLVVAPAQRSGGVGKLLVAHAEEEARALGVKAIYLLTTTAQTFFSHCGYATLERGEAPELIRATREFASLCPATAVLMSKRLSSNEA